MAQKFELTWRELPKFVVVLAMFFGIVWMCSGEEDKPQPAVVVAPLPPVPVTDARLYVPSDLPGMKVSRGFLGSGDTQREARISGTLGASSVTILASSLGEKLDMSAGQPIKVGAADGYSSKSGEGQAITWMRGEVMLRVSFYHPAMDDAGMMEAAKKRAEEVNAQADAVIAMAPEQRAQALGRPKNGL